MDWKTSATDVSPIVQPCRVWQHLGKSDLGQRRLRPRAREAEAFFSRRPCPCDHGAGTNTLEQKARFWQILLQKSQNAVRLIFRKKTKQAAIVDRCSFRPATEVASRRSPEPEVAEPH
jgi:hypothetical protein